jgi:branched-subunit amino acid ABC-type transport system permease component
VFILEPFLSATPLRAGSVVISVDRLILVGIAFSVTVVLWMAFRYTLLGLATRGAAENRRAASALGWSSDRLATFNWFLGGALAAVAGALIAPISGLQADQMPRSRPRSSGIFHRFRSRSSAQS